MFSMIAAETMPATRRIWAGLRPGPGSLVLRMTAWYAGSALVMILAATGFLYWQLATSFDAEDRRTLSNSVADLRLLLRASGELRLPDAGTFDRPVPVRRPQQLWVRLLAADGTTLLETPSMGQDLPPTAFPDLTRVTVGHDVDAETAPRAGRLFQTLSARVSEDPAHPDGRVLQVAMDRADEEALLVHYRERLWLVLTASVLLCAAIGYAIARRGMRPVRRITAIARRVRTSTLHERIEPGGLPEELRSLAETFNEMLDRLEVSFAQVSQFSADVAHELRTPVNNLRGEIEVALGKARSAEEYRDTLGSALEECLRLSRLIQSLLFLARAESPAGGPHHDTVDVGREILAVLEFYEAAAADGGVALGIEGDRDVTASLDRVLFQQAIGNLVANAIDHTPAGGTVSVRVRHDAGRLWVEVADTGRGIAPAHLPHVFERFYRADRARSGATDNLGLGLAVVRSIAALHNGTVSLSSTLGVGTRVVVEFALGESVPEPILPARSPPSQRSRTLDRIAPNMSEASCGRSQNVRTVS